MKTFDIESWLRNRSTKVERVGAEIIFTHLYNKTSVLLPREGWHDGLLAMEKEPLASFYAGYFGASLGNSQLTFATNIEGGVEVSHGFRLPDFEQMKERAQELAFNIGESEQPFLAEAGWMFIYTVCNESVGPVIRMYDRDLGTVRKIQSLEEVLNEWWKVVIGT